MDKQPLFRTLMIAVGIGLIGWGCLVILEPFLPAMLLAIIFCLATWPAFSALQARVGGRSWLAALIMSILLFIGFLLPLFFLGSSLADNVTQLITYVVDSFKNTHGRMPEWIETLPLWMRSSAEYLWQTYFINGQQMVQSLSHYAAPLTHQVFVIGKKVGQGLVDLSMGIFISFFFFLYGAQAIKRIGILMRKFIGEHGLHLLHISKDTLISVVYGILGTAVAQGAVAGLGFWIANVPGAAFLGFLTVIMSLIPGGPPLVWVPVTIWIFVEGHIGMGVFMAIWGLLAISGVDNIVRPYFISLGSDLPLLLVLLGVLGGLVAFGFIGLFIGPTLLAVAYALLLEWSHEEEKRLDA